MAWGIFAGMSPAPLIRAGRAVLLAGLALTVVPSAASAQMVIELTDFAQAPITGKFGGEANLWPLARINVMRPEPGSQDRFFVADLKGPLYIFDKSTKSFTTYLDFNGRDERQGLFQRFTFLNGWANGLITVQFDPDYATNGRFYTLHLEEPQLDVPAAPAAGVVPGLDLTGYEPAEPEPIAGAVERHGVLIEWTDTNTADTTFQGKARELIRFSLNTRIHPPGDIVFNPTARPGDADWRVMYLSVGDSGAGEQKDERRANPQRLDQLVGKILRIVPDLDARQATTTVSRNGRYRVPNDNPFVDIPGARPEIWTLGFRNPHRLWWDVDPSGAAGNRLIAMHIGQHSWESVDFVERGANFGYSEREGNKRMRPTDNLTEALPDDDTVPLRVDATTTHGTVTPSYPVLQYSHAMGLAIAGGLVYRGERIPELQGKFIFGDIANGRLWYADYDAMIAADDGKPETLAEFHPIRIRWTPPGADAPVEYSNVREVAAAGFEARRAADPSAGAAPVPSRADLRLAVDADGELYVTTKTDGTIRAVVGATMEQAN